MKLNTLENSCTDFLVPKTIFNTISNVAEQLKQPVFVIGGFVRDKILKRETKDIDIVTLGSGIDLANKIAKELNLGPVKIFKNFGTAMILVNDIEIQFVGARKESYKSDSRNPII